MSIATEIETLKTNLTNAYTSISAKGGTIPANKNAQNLSSAIDSITTGGSTPVVEAEKKDINFYDYDGTRLYSWTLAELATKTELPALPTQQGLICQGWNWTLAELKEQNTKMNVGAMYITDDGKTRIYIHLDKYELNPCIRFNTSGSNKSVEINWGDGSNLETVATASSPVIHTYTSAGDYVITLNPLNETKISLIGDNKGINLISANIYADYSRNNYYTACIKKIELGNGVTEIGNYALANSTNLKTISVPTGVEFKGMRMFSYSGIEYVTVSKKFSADNQFEYSAIKHISLPPMNNYMGNYSFAYMHFLEDVCYPKSATSGQFYNANNENYGLKEVIWSGNVIESNGFQQCKSLIKVQCINNVTSVTTAFNYCYALRYITFLANTVVPTLASSTVFNYTSSDYKVVVPDSLYDEWIQATNWATISSKIIKASEWEG